MTYFELNHVFFSQHVSDQDGVATFCNSYPNWMITNNYNYHNNVEW